MDIQEFRRVLTTFADSPASVDMSKGLVVLQLGDEVVEARITQREGALLIEEDGVRLSAPRWIANRIARLPLLADRILSYTPAPQNYVRPSGSLLDQLEQSYETGDIPVDVTDAGTSILEVLDRQPGGTTSVLYLTSDAGEGKTTLINQLAREQAQAFKEKRSHWLLVPIPLGGRAFLRFDDVVIAALVNRLRFQRLYFDAFVELVRLGFIVPAFDGFEEMFIEGTGSEAPTALGNLVKTLKSSGTALFAARKAYFEYQSLRTQARLFDAIGTDSVSFARLTLSRWNRDHFCAYGKLRGVDEPHLIFEIVANRFGNPEHPLLTRAVLVRRLFDIVVELKDFNELVALLGQTPRDYFHEFVSAIVEREANEKWLDKVGDPQLPLLSIEQHLELLSLVAQEMWSSNTNNLRAEILDVIVDLFCDEKKMSAAATRQVKERIKQHSLIVATAASQPSYSFDHEDFQSFFLGEALGRALHHEQINDIRSLLSASPLPSGTCDEAIQFLRRAGGSIGDAISLISRLASTEPPTSFAKENSGALACRLLDGADSQVAFEVDSIVFPADSLTGKSFKGCRFSSCRFMPLNLQFTSIFDCEFVGCRFERIQIDSSHTISNVRLHECEIDSLFIEETEEHIFDPSTIAAKLISIGFSFPVAPATSANTRIDENLRLVERVARIFLRSTYVNEHFIAMKLGQSFAGFMQDVLPTLLRSGVVQEVPYLGKGTQRRFRLRASMQSIQDAIQRSSSLDDFVSKISE
jgi:hypothetical protein